MIGDAAHAMLPLQGQGASQSIEDAEAIVAYLGGCSSATSVADIRAALKVSTVEVKLEVCFFKWSDDRFFALGNRLYRMLA